MFGFSSKDPFDRLYSEIRKNGIGINHNSSELITLIDSVRKGEIHINHIQDHEIRKRVEDLLLNFHDERERRVYEILFTYVGYFAELQHFDFNHLPSSGWKLHVYGENAIDSFKTYQILRHSLEHYKLSYKLATARFYRGRSKRDIQYGKALTIYIPMVLFYNKTVVKVIDYLNKLLSHGSYLKKGKIKGDKHYKGSIHYRYEMHIPIQTNGFNRRFYHANYRANNGKDYNIENNIDLFQALTKLRFPSH